MVGKLERRGFLASLAAVLGIAFTLKATPAPTDNGWINLKTMTVSHGDGNPTSEAPESGTFVTTTEPTHDQNYRARMTTTYKGGRIVATTWTRLGS